MRKGVKFRLYGWGPWVQVTHVSKNKVHFRFRATRGPEITGSIPKHQISEHLQA